MIKEAEGAEGAEGAGGEVFWLGCLIMVNHPDLILNRDTLVETRWDGIRVQVSDFSP